MVLQEGTLTRHATGGNSLGFSRRWLEEAMVQVEVRLYATLRRYAPDLGPTEPLRLELRQGTTVGDLIADLKVPAEEVKRVFVNYRSVSEDHVLQHGDRVGIFPLVAGG